MSFQSGCPCSRLRRRYNCQGDGYVLGLGGAGRASGFLRHSTVSVDFDTPGNISRRGRQQDQQGLKSDWSANDVQGARCQQLIAQSWLRVPATHTATPELKQRGRMCSFFIVFLLLPAGSFRIVSRIPISALVPSMGAWSSSSWAICDN